ncbi:serine/threonine-protein kinase [Nocardioides currus]|uniref:serine/threonine-protein kinase n=1 Tax=Nocardioides currus TaxID=2133958 RepID=UPI001402F93F|nr:serine/threonine-protein kinase [Nocardioides currus]
MIAGRYSLGRELGRGGMGSVHLARDEVLGREVAIKRIGMLPGATGPDLARAEREARLAAMLNHPHVVSVFDLVADQDQHWLVMEYVDGQSLADRIRAEGALDHAAAAQVMWQVADALASAHAAGITHRDVKPSNILLSTSGEAKLTDFGIARSTADASLTQTGLVTGSPAYLAPEVASGSGASAASDVWSLGATLFHVLSGHAAYDVGDNLIGGLYKIVHEEPPRLADAGAFDTLLRATMAREPSDRWPMERVRDRLAEIRLDPAAEGVTSTTTLVTDPSPASDTSPVTEVIPPVPPVEPVTPVEPDGRPRRRAVWPWLAALGAAVLAVVLVLALTDDDPADEPKQEEPTAAPTSETTSDSPTTPAVDTDQEIRDFITTYLDTVTTDRRATYAMLTADFKAESGGFAGYSRFWRTIASATPSNIVVDAEDLTVSYDVDYRTVSGGSDGGSVRLQLERVDGGYLIAGEG